MPHKLKERTPDDDVVAIKALRVVGGRDFVLLAVDLTKPQPYAGDVFTSLPDEEMFALVGSLVTGGLVTPDRDPDKRPLLDRVMGDDRQLAVDMKRWLGPVLGIIADPELRARCELLLGVAAMRLENVARARRAEGEG